MLLRRLRHPNILEFSGVFVTKKLGLYLVTEYVEGGTLRQFIKDKSRYAAHVLGAGSVEVLWDC
jgi:serine/threonine protein kinase